MIDCTIVVLYFIGIVCIGLWTGRSETSLSDFSLGRRQIPWWAVLASIIAAETTAATFLGMPAEGYILGNFTLLQAAFGMILGRIVVGTFFIRKFYQHQVYSIYEYLGIRFGKKTRQLASAIFLVTRILASGTRLYFEAILLTVLFRILLGRFLSPHEEILLYCGSIILLSTLTSIYTIFGGIKAVIWTDLIQVNLMILGAASCCLFLYFRLPTEVQPLIHSLQWFNSGIDANTSLASNLRTIISSPYTIWTAVFANTILTMATHGTDQDMTQRMLTAKTFRASRLSVILSGIADLPVIFLFLTIGILLKHHFQSFPDPNIPSKTNEIFPYFILTYLPTGFRGLLVAGLFATTMGSLSAATNALATSFTRDWGHLFKRSLNPNSKKSELLFARMSTLFFSVILASVACITAIAVIHEPSFRIIPIALGIFGYTYGSLLGIFILGIFTKNRGNDTSNIVAMVGGILGVTVIGGIPGYFNGICPFLAFPWRILIGTAVTFGIAVSSKSQNSTKASG